MKKMSKLVCALMLVIAMLAAVGCGGGGGSSSGGGAAADPNEGKYIAMSAEMWGIQTPVTDIYENGFTFDLSGGKVTMDADGSTAKGKYTIEGDTIKMDIDGVEMVGTIGNDLMTIDDLLGMGLKMVFAKEGTDAANPENFIPEEEKALIGDWSSESVLPIMEEEPYTSIEGLDDIHDALRVSFYEDHTCSITFFGEDLGTYDWDNSFGLNIDCDLDSVSIYPTLADDGSLSIDISTEDDYVTYNMVKD
ncbi:MAG: hypothetical protein Q4B73_02680 [Lachnospiraceae bacterium]|nr:hypothetical protein [Lachnospiraceae bacterium]